MSGWWRQTARRKINQALRDPKCPPEDSPRERKAFINSQYPFGPREYYPYKVWMEELNRVAAEPTPSEIKNWWVK
jgi:hypothetical protein